MKVLALDFDGVISDSAAEAFVVALRTWAALEPDSALAASPLAAPGGAPTRADIEAAPPYPAFVEHMPLGNRAEDFGVVLAAIDQAVPLPRASISSLAGKRLQTTRALPAASNASDVSPKVAPSQSTTSMFQLVPSHLIIDSLFE